MNVLVNLSHLKIGGGQNVGLNFISTLKHVDTADLNFVFIVAKNSIIHKYLLDNKFSNIYLYPHNPILRTIKELFYSKKILKKHSIDIIYNYFGVDLIPVSIKRVMGAADSNLFYPELDFWVEYNPIQKLVRKTIDLNRIWGLKKATAVIFENGFLQKRGKELFKLKETKLIKPSVKDFVSDDNDLLFQCSKNTKVGLFFCGWQRNKNYMIIPELAKELKSQKINYHFLITAPKNNSFEHKEFLLSLKNYNVLDMVSIIGPVHKKNISSLYNSIDHVFLLSKLESFSNNIIESWYYKKPLLISNEDWARYLCHDSACYVDRSSSKSIISSIKKILDNDIYKNKLVSAGSRILKSYPTVAERTISELKYLKYVYKNY